MARNLRTKVLVTGALGQVGRDLLPLLKATYGQSNIVLTDVAPESPYKDVEYIPLNILDESGCQRVFDNYKPGVVYHLASFLSAQSELNPKMARKVNIEGLHNIFDQAAALKSQFFAASTIASFGPSSPKIPGNLAIQRPITLYGTTKVYLELIGEWYNRRDGLDFRCIRIPVVNSVGRAGGGSCSFTVNMFYDLFEKGHTVVPIAENVKFPLIYNPDVLDSIVQLMQAEESKLTARTYTSKSIGVSVGDYVEAVMKHFPKGKVEIVPDFRSEIVRTWPDGTDGSQAEKDWGHNLSYSLETMVADMHSKIKQLLKL